MQTIVPADGVLHRLRGSGSSKQIVAIHNNSPLRGSGSRVRMSLTDHKPASIA
jgi:hypothetical protein